MGACLDDGSKKPAMSIAKRFIHGSGLNLIDHGFKLAAMLVTTPLVIGALGKDGYGYWVLAMSVLSYFAFLDLGVSFSTTRFLSMAAGAKDVTKQALVCHFAKTHFGRIGNIILGGGVLALAALAVLSNLPEGWSAGTVLAATLPGGISMAVRFRYRLPQLLLRAWIRYDLLAAASISRVVFQSTSLFVALSAGGGVIAVGLIHAVADLVELGLQRRFASFLPLVPDPVGVTAEEMLATRQEMTRYTRDVVIGSFGDSVRAGSGPQVTSIVAGMDAVAVYSLGTRLISMLEDVVNAVFGGSTLSVFGHLHGASDREAMTSTFRRLLGLTAGFCAAAMGGVVLFAGPFILLWLGPEFKESLLVVQILAVPHALMLMQYPAHSLLYTLGLQRSLMWVRCIGGVSVCVVGYLFGRIWGVSGVVAASALEVGICNTVVMSVLLSRVLNVSAGDYLIRWLIWPGIKGLAFPLIIGLMVSPWIHAGYLGLIGGASLYGLAMIFSVVFVVMTGQDRLLFARLFRPSRGIVPG